ncbi:MAG: hypothetical protein AAEJ52_06060 [Myxococcota bacterium]
MPDTPSAPVEEASASARLHAPPPAVLLVSVLTVFSLAVLVGAWTLRGQRYVVADRGLGYALGILGLSAMLLLLLYPVRKHGWAFRRVAPIRFWFHAHMALGILGPTLVLLHSNFQLGSTNSTVALVSALVVGSSGYVGRFAYARIHYGLSGERMHFAEVREDVRELRSGLQVDFPDLATSFEEFEEWASAAGVNALTALLRFGSTRSRVERLRDQVPWDQLSGSALELAHRLEDYLQAAQRLARFHAYEKLFGTWHALHIPLCFFLFTAALVHVLAVHAY